MGWVSSVGESRDLLAQACDGQSGVWVCRGKGFSDRATAPRLRSTPHSGFAAGCEARAIPRRNSPPVKLRGLASGSAFGLKCPPESGRAGLWARPEC